MTRTCHLERPGCAGTASWQLTPEMLVLTPQGRPVESFMLREVRGLDWDDWSVRLSFGAGDVTLSRLGSEHSGLLEALRDAWPALRADALRISSGSQPLHFRGAAAVSSGGPLQPAEILVDADAILLAPRGHDLEPVFLASISRLERDDDALALVARRFTGNEVRLAKLGARTDEVRAAIESARARLAGEGAVLLAARLPSLDPMGRTALAAQWLPGRLMSLEAVEATAAGAAAAIRASWLKDLPRRREGALLLDLVGPGDVWLGYTRPGEDGAALVAAAVQPPEEELAELAVGTAPEETSVGVVTGGAGNLWAVARVPGGFVVESLGEKDVATYVFRGGPELLEALSLVACAPQYSREAVYLPLEELTGPRMTMAVAARDLAPLHALRAAFVRRVIHRSTDSWSAAMRSLVSAGVEAIPGT